MRSIVEKRWFRSLLCLSLMPSMTGCTVALWTPACATQAMHPQIAGLVRNYPGQGGEALVVVYRAPGDGTDVDLVVPLDANRLPRFPFGIVRQGYAVRILGSKDAVELAGSVDQKQMSAILASSRTIPADREKLKSHFNAVDWSPAGGTQPAWPGDKLDRQGTAVAIAYRVDATGQIMPVPLDTSNQPDDKIILDDDVHVLLVPALVDRPPGDQTRNKVVAVALTPLAVAGDAAGTGIVIGVLGVAIGIAIPVAVVVGIDYALHPPAPGCNRGGNAGNNNAPQEPPATLQVPIYHAGERQEQTASVRLKQWITSMAMMYSPSHPQTR
jgi:hypothetical protein